MMAGEAIWISWLATFLHGPAAAAGVAIVNAIGNLGGLLGSALLGYLKTHLQGGYAASMPLLGTLTVLAACSNFLLHWSIFSQQSRQQNFMPIAQVCRGPTVVCFFSYSLSVVVISPCKPPSHNTQMHCLHASQDCDDEAFEEGEDACLAVHAMEVEDGRSGEETLCEEVHTLLPVASTRKL